MATNSENILEKARRQGIARPSAGMSVPEGYFADFNARMAAMLPDRPEIEHPEALPQPKRSFWNVVRPYVYMAAMFAGVWLTLKMFASITGIGSLEPIDDNPVLAEALVNDDFVFDYVAPDFDSWDVLDEMMEDGTLDPAEPIDFLEEPGDDSTQPYILPQ